MKSSKYNFFYKMRNRHDYIAYNSVSNALALIPDIQYECFKSFQADPLYNLDEAFVSELRKGHFIIDDDVDELELIRERMLKFRYNTTTLGLTIAPTLKCNFHCVYCYEKGCDKNGFMSEEVQNQTVEYIKQHASTINHLSITWYGGEPLLAIDIIEKLTDQFLKICCDNNISYNASIVTNGYLLTLEIVNRLIACKVSNCQVTIDGDRKTHNIRRPHASGIDTYDTILHNAFEASHFFPVAIRVNTDKNNTDAVFYIRDAANKNGFTNIIVYPAPIRANNDCYMEDVCLNSTQFFEFEYQYITSTNNSRDLLRKYPTLHGNSCCADSLNALVISEDGSLYKCWSDIGRKDLCLGNIVDRSYSIAKAIRYSKYDPTRDKKCSKCKFLPICMGGCPRDVYDRPNDRCNHLKKLHRLYIMRIATVIKQQEISAERMYVPN